MMSGGRPSVGLASPGAMPGFLSAALISAGFGAAFFCSFGFD
jgi:hypothetical protein